MKISRWLEKLTLCCPCLWIVIGGLVIQLDLKAQWQPVDTAKGVDYIRKIWANDSALFVAENASDMPIWHWDGQSLRRDSSFNCTLGTSYDFTEFQGKVYASGGGGCLSYVLDTSGWKISFTGDAPLFYYVDSNYLIGTGWFDQINGIPMSRIAKYDGQSWSAIDTTKWYSSASIAAIRYKGELYMGGLMNNWDASIDNLARFDGTKWHPVGNNQMASGAGGVSTFAIYDNELWMGGGFHTSMGNPGDGIARWDGQNWIESGSNPADYPLDQLLVYRGELYACGGFTYLSGKPIKHVAKWDGEKWCGLEIELDSKYSFIKTMAVFQGDLYIAGRFETINGDSIRNIARWTGETFTGVCGDPVGQAPGIANPVNSFTIYPNPTRHGLVIELQNPTYQNIELVLLNSLGQQVQIIEVTQYRSVVDTGHLPPGMYVIADPGGRLLSKKVVIR